MNQFSAATRILLAGVIGGGVCVAGVSLIFARFDNPAVMVVLLFLAAVTAVLGTNLPLSGSNRSVGSTASYLVDLTALLTLAPDGAMLVAMVGAWSRGTFRIHRHSSTICTLFGMAGQAIAMRGAAVVLVALAGPRSLLTGWAWLGPYAASAVVYFLLASSVRALLRRIETGGGAARRAWHRSLLWSLQAWLVAAGAAPAVAILIERSDAWLIPLALGPLVLAYYAHRLYLRSFASQERKLTRASDLQMATIEALAIAIDAKDRSSPSHVRREQLYAASLARAFHMSEDEIQGVKTAALLHDIGKLAVPEHILSKPGPLTLEEFQKVRIHPQIGAEIIAGVPFPYPVAPLVLCHHERWDGSGYPAGLQGLDIPLGARVLAVVDYFEALTSDRPFHKAISYDAAIDVLWQEAGKALDPVIVAGFVELLPSLQAHTPEVETTTSVSSVAATLPPADPETDQRKLLNDIARAHKEIYNLYEVAQAMGTSLGVSDSMTMIASKLRNLVPFSSCALFLCDKESDAVRCRFATGMEADALRPLVMHEGFGLNGWVVSNREPILNGRPAADLEAAGLRQPKTNLQSALVCPLIFNDRVIGALALYHVEPQRFTEDHRRLASRVSEQAAAVIYNSIVFEQTQEDSLTDPLTGLPNTRFMFVHLTRELARASRLRSSIALLVLDLDSLKHINDSFGHNVGDRALRAVAGVLRSAIRPYDICVRYGGDEFIVVLSDCGSDECEAKRVELQKAVAALPFESRGGQPVALSISVGAAVFPADGESYETLLAAADSRMYRDKASHKGPTVLPGPGIPPAHPVISEADMERAAAGVL